MKEPEDFLAHYGKLGMKWGVVNNDSSSSQSSRSIQKTRNEKAKKYEIRANTLNTRISKISNTKTNFFYTKGQQKRDIKDLTKERDRALKDVQAKKDGKLSSGQKKAIIGASIVGALMLGTAVRSGLNSGVFTQVSAKGKAFLSGKKVPQFKMNPNLTGKKSLKKLEEDVVRHINPGFPGFGTTNNCKRASYAYELRRRGFDVRATRTENGYGQHFIGRRNVLLPGEKPLPTGPFGLTWLARNEKGRDVIANTMEDYGTWGKNPVKNVYNVFEEIAAANPEGARGELGLKWMFGGGHSISWEVVNGKAVIIDNQLGKVFKNMKDFEKGYESVGALGVMQEAAWTRLDNVDLNMDFLLRWVEDVR